MKKVTLIVCILAALIASVFLWNSIIRSDRTRWNPGLNAVAPSWDRLAPAGKGVLLVKVNSANGNEYFVIKGTNLNLPLSTITKYGIRFESIGSLAEFLVRKPKGYIVIPGDNKNVDDDLGRLGEFSVTEESMIRGLLDWSEPGTTSGYW
jgi:hypothetical protein